MKKRWGVVIALFIPILAFIVQIAHIEYEISTGKEVVLRITGYDPRDILSGYYLFYNVDYGFELRDDTTKSNRKTRYICLDEKKISHKRPKNCERFIKGFFDFDGIFRAGIERYYVPEERVARLEELIRDLENEVEIVIVLSKRGRARIKDLLVNGYSWRNW